MQLVFATRNAGKLKEARALLPAITLLGAGETSPPLPEVEETGETFEANAELKARSGCRATGLPCLADDSGLEVDALGGRPGVRSARYGGPGLSDADRNARLLKELEGVEVRRARFVCAIAFVQPDGRVQVVRGTCEGRIAKKPSGMGGFGYDPLFVPDGYAESFGVLPEEVKNKLSHRARALAAASAWF